eukprot:501823-Amorphochlora_amoeboformis.AAC.1
MHRYAVLAKPQTRRITESNPLNTKADLQLVNNTRSTFCERLRFYEDLGRRLCPLSIGVKPMNYGPLRLFLAGSSSTHIASRRRPSLREGRHSPPSRFCSWFPKV